MAQGPDTDFPKLLKDIASEQSRARKLAKQADDCYAAARRYQRAAQRLEHSRFFKAWRRVRALLGKKTPAADGEDRLRRGMSPYAASPALAEELALQRALAADGAPAPAHGTPSYYGRADVRVGVVCDEFNFRFIRDAAQVTYLTPDNHRALIDAGELDLVVCFCAWFGLKTDLDSGRQLPLYYRGTEGVRRNAAVARYAREHGVPVVYQTSEDPVSYERFLPVAREADVVFTSAEECVDRYRRDLGHDRVHVARFAVNPCLHNPAGLVSAKRDDPALSQDVLFAGAWYPAYGKRNADAHAIFDGVMDAGHRLLIVDRNSEVPATDKLFPPEYAPCLLPSMDAGRLTALQRLVHFSVNLNTVTESRTMCARRIYEAQAQGGLLLSNHALSVGLEFPGVFGVSEPSEVGRILDGYTNDELLSMEIEAARDVLCGQTVYDRLNELFSAAGIPARFPERPVWVVVDDPADEGARSWLAGQLQVRGARLATARKAGAQEAGFAVAPPVPYPENPWWLVDLLNAFKYTDAAWAAYAPGAQGAYDPACADAAPADAPRMVDLSRLPASACTGELAADAPRGFLLCEPRWGRDTADAPKDLAVIVAVRNDGRFLWQRAFRSLLRSSAFPRMRVYLMDRGSDDGATPRLLSWMARAFDNVEVRFVGDVSAARARNEGLALCRESFVAWLDPACEAVGDGLALLLSDAGLRGVDVAFGDVLAVDVAGGGTWRLSASEAEGMLDDPRAILARPGFLAQGARACVARREALVRGGVSWVEGPVDLDPLFTVQLLAAARGVVRRPAAACVCHLDGRRLDAAAPDAVAEEAPRRAEPAMGADALYDELHALRGHNAELRDEAVRAHDAACRLRSGYRSIVNSRAVRAWMRVRALLGRETPLEDAAVPDVARPAAPFAPRQEGKRFAETYPRLIADIPDSDGSSYFGACPVRLGVIADEFAFNYYRGAAQVVYVSPEDYRTVVPSLDCLLYVTCWQGVGHFGAVDSEERRHYAGDAGVARAAEVLAFARSAGVPAVFQSIEDPPNFERFLPIAREADVIFTSAAEMIPRYRERTGNPNVHSLRFAVNPVLHNPIGMARKALPDRAGFARGAFFAGSWMKKYPDRCASMRVLFDGVADAMRPGGDMSLYIADRNLLRANHKAYAFPQKYERFVAPPIEYRELQKVHKLFHFSLNLNSVTESLTMCAQRVYEVQALGGLVLTNYARGASGVFPGVFTAVDSSEVGRILKGYTQDELLSLEAEGARGVLGDQTVHDRLNEVFAAAGVGWRFEGRPLFVVVDRADAAARAFAAGQLDVSGVRLVEAAQAREHPEALAAGFAVRLRAPYPQNPWWLADLLNAFKYTDAAWAAYAPAEAGWEGAYEYAECPVPGNAGPRMVDAARLPLSACEGALDEGPRGFLLAEPRWGRDTAGVEKELAVVVPVRDDGRKLWGRAFRSLLRSSAFARMRVYLVDDGSSDRATLRMVDWMAATFDNVRAFGFGDGGSGSAARARAKGAELAEEPYVAWLDPADEAVGDGYALMLDALRESGADLAFADWWCVKPGGGERATGARGADAGAGAIDDPAAHLAASGFAPQCLQACVARRELAAGQAACVPQGAADGDELLSLALMLAARTACRVDACAVQRYEDLAAVADPAVPAAFFERLVPVHAAQARLLERHGLLEEFRDRRLAAQVRDEFEPALSRVPADERPRAARALVSLVRCYDAAERGPARA